MSKLFRARLEDFLIQNRKGMEGIEAMLNEYLDENEPSQVIARGTDSQGRTIEVIEREGGSICLYYNMGHYHSILFDTLDEEKKQ